MQHTCLLITPSRSPCFFRPSVCPPGFCGQTSALFFSSPTPPRHHHHHHLTPVSLYDLITPLCLVSECSVAGVGGRLVRLLEIHTTCLNRDSVLSTTVMIMILRACVREGESEGDGVRVREGGRDGRMGGWMNKCVLYSELFLV